MYFSYIKFYFTIILNLNSYFLTYLGLVYFIKSYNYLINFTIIKIIINYLFLICFY